jgi:hypothetical protein
MEEFPLYSSRFGSAAVPLRPPWSAESTTDDRLGGAHREVRRWSGKLAGANSRASDVFTLLKLNGDWTITHKLFHWHSD